MEHNAQMVRPVWGLQYMLSRLAEKHPFLPRLTPDGVFGEKTLEAVMLFQRELLRPVTGVVDRRTWDEISRAWSRLEREQAGPRALRAFPGEGRQVAPGQEREFMALPQLMFRLLSYYLEGVSPDLPDGRHGTASEQNVRWLQERAGLPVTGVMDQATWDALARLYELFVVKDLEQLEQKYSGGWG